MQSHNCNSQISLSTSTNCSGCAADAGPDCGHSRQCSWFHQARRSTFQKCLHTLLSREYAPVCSWWKLAQSRSSQAGSQTQERHREPKSLIKVKKPVQTTAHVSLCHKQTKMKPLSYVVYLPMEEQQISKKNDQMEKKNQWWCMKPCKGWIKNHINIQYPWDMPSGIKV